MVVGMAASTSTVPLTYFNNVQKGFFRTNSRRIYFGVTASMSNLADSSALLQVAKHTVDTYVKGGMVIGLGCGQASGMAIQYLGRQLRTGSLKDIVGIPMSVASASEAAKAGIPLDYYQDSSQIDFAFDDADVIEEGTLVAVIGRRKLEGGESIMQEKLNWMETAEEIDDLFLGDAEDNRRN